MEFTELEAIGFEATDRPSIKEGPCPLHPNCHGEVLLRNRRTVIWYDCPNKGTLEELVAWVAEQSPTSDSSRPMASGEESGNVQRPKTSERDYPNSGIIFRNDNKERAKDRDYRGTADVTCPHCSGRSHFWLSGWIKDGRNGKFLSLSFKAKDPQPDAGDSDAPF